MYRASFIISALLIAAACMATQVALAQHADGRRDSPLTPYQAKENADYRLVPVFQPTDIDALLLADQPHAAAIEEAARREHLDPLLVHAVIDVESGHNAKAVSPKGAIGLMQVLPETAERFGSNLKLTQVDDNLRAGTRYLRMLIDRFDQRIDLALAAYNAGENAVEKYGRQIPPYPETRKYVPAVLKRYADAQPPPVPTHKAYLSGTLLNTGWAERIAKQTVPSL
jgi:soluble lytic murein transglycosylase-like protein